ncbi:MAG: nucleotidyltransferase domain-containing protein [Desulfitobacteriaceae bacterium]
MDQDIRNVIDKLSKVKEVESIYLFGSQAAGAAMPDSDLDLLIVWALPVTGKHRTVRKTLRRLIGPTTKPLDLILYSREELAEAILDDRSFASTVLSHGRILYGRLHGLSTLDVESTTGFANGL